MLNENINLFLEIDTEKKAIYISENRPSDITKGCAKRYRNKRDISRIFNNYLFHNINIYPKIEEENYKNGRRNKRKKY